MRIICIVKISRFCESLVSNMNQTHILGSLKELKLDQAEILNAHGCDIALDYNPNQPCKDRSSCLVSISTNRPITFIENSGLKPRPSRTAFLGTECTALRSQVGHHQSKKQNS
jgi:hypothetical protein